MIKKLKLIPAAFLTWHRVMRTSRISGEKFYSVIYRLEEAVADPRFGASHLTELQRVVGDIDSAMLRISMGLEPRSTAWRIASIFARRKHARMQRRFDRLKRFAQQSNARRFANAQ